MEGRKWRNLFDITDMSTVAEERNFIAVFPTADFYQIRQDGLRSVRVWNGNYEGKQIDSEKFVRTMIEDIKGRHRVDNTRIFACGQSSGGYMASYCALAASDLFTAVSPWSGFSLPGGKGPFLITRNITSRTVTFLLHVNWK